LQTQGNAQVKANTTFENLKGVDIFKVVEEVIKEMERLQNLDMANGDDRNHMENKDHRGVDENHVLTTMENNPNMKAINK
jgi:hypothetical protein